MIRTVTTDIVGDGFAVRATPSDMAASRRTALHVWFSTATRDRTVENQSEHLQGRTERKRLRGAQRRSHPHSHFPPRRQ
jgi:hypothetical protein